MTPRKREAGVRIRVVEFLHSSGWTPVEIVHGRGRLTYWRKRCPAFEHRYAAYVRLPAPTKRGRHG